MNDIRIHDGGTGTMDTIDRDKPPRTTRDGNATNREDKAVNLAQRTGIAGMLFALLGSPVFAANDYLTADGKLAQRLDLTVTETGGFVGVQSYSYTISPSGEFAHTYAIGNGPGRKSAGTLSAAALAKLANTLEQNKLAELPPRIVGQAKPPVGSADIPTADVSIRWGEKPITARYVSGVQEADPPQSHIRSVNAIISGVRTAVQESSNR